MKIFILVVCASVALASCTTDDDPGEYFTSNFSDVISEVLPMDSIHVVLTQTGTPEHIPFHIEDQSSLEDTIRVMLSVETGSYRQRLTPQKGVSIHSDTLRQIPVKVTRSINHDLWQTRVFRIGM